MDYSTAQKECVYSKRLDELVDTVDLWHIDILTEKVPMVPLPISRIKVFQSRRKVKFSRVAVNISVCFPTRTPPERMSLNHGL